MPKDTFEDTSSSQPVGKDTKQQAEDLPSVKTLLARSNWDDRLAEARERRKAALAAREAGSMIAVAAPVPIEVDPVEPVELHEEPSASPTNRTATKLAARGAWLAAGVVCGALAVSWIDRGETPLAASPKISRMVAVAPAVVPSMLGAAPAPTLGSSFVPPNLGPTEVALAAPAGADTPVALDQDSAGGALVTEAWVADIPNLVSPAETAPSTLQLASASVFVPPQPGELVRPAVSGQNLATAPSAPQPTAKSAPVRLVVFAPSGLSTQAVTPALDALRSAGFDNATANSVDLRIRTTQVRVYHASDRPAAAELAAATGATLRDFAEFTPAPPPGTVELWLAGTSAVRDISTARRTTEQPALALRGRMSNLAGWLGQPATRRTDILRESGARRDGDRISGNSHTETASAATDHGSSASGKHRGGAGGGHHSGRAGRHN